MSDNTKLIEAINTAMMKLDEAIQEYEQDWRNYWIQKSRSNTSNRTTYPRGVLDGLKDTIDDANKQRISAGETSRVLNASRNKK